MGRAVLSAREINCMEMTASVINLYRTRARSQNWAEWAKQDPRGAAILTGATRAANGE